eukprot:873520-Pyramimonas_sp.AAC.1
MFEFILSQSGALAELEDEPHLLALLIEGHRDTHFGTARQEDQDVARSRRGSRPGSSLADAIVNISIVKPLKAIEAELYQHGLSLELSVPAGSETFSPGLALPTLLDVSFVDDGLHLLAPRSTGEAVNTAGLAVDCVHKHMATHGFTVNYKRHKSSVMIIPAGAGARDLTIRRQGFLKRQDRDTRVAR